MWKGARAKKIDGRNGWRDAWRNNCWRTDGCRKIGRQVSVGRTISIG